MNEKASKAKKKVAVKAEPEAIAELKSVDSLAGLLIKLKHCSSTSGKEQEIATKIANMLGGSNVR